MNIITDFLAIARAPIPDGKEARTVAMAEAESALNRLDAARDRIQAELSEATARRRALLLDDRPEAKRQLAMLDKSSDDLSLDLERLDAAEEVLIERCRALDDRKCADDLAALVDAYVEGVKRWTGAMALVVEARNALVAIRERAIAEGHESRLAEFDLPHQNFPTNAEAILNFQNGAIGSARNITLLPRPAAVFVLRIIKSIPPYRVGELTGFPAEQAWQWVDAGYAEWADPRRRAPRPAAQGAA